MATPVIAPVVALESAIIAHGLPPPDHITTPLAAAAVIREMGAVPATIAILAGALRVGLSVQEIEHLAKIAPVKVSRHNMAAVLAAGGDGATTVAATMTAAHLANIRVFATGGIGGVHRGGERTMDISADLPALAQIPMIVVSAGIKTILDLPRTMEYLETWGVPVIGFGCETLPGFYLRTTDLPLAAHYDDPSEIAALAKAHWAMGGGGILVVTPVPSATAETDATITAALSRISKANKTKTGPQVTPQMLRTLAQATDGLTVRLNKDLLINNARRGAQIACAFKD
ncbi:MAG: pseudouridine-5'-phosphate glycosidase [Pseudomonadota bacterium]